MYKEWIEYGIRRLRDPKILGEYFGTVKDVPKCEHVTECIVILKACIRRR